MTERKYNERHDRQKTHELVVLNNTPASSPEQNYAQLKTIRSPDNTYEQLVLRQVSHNEKCEDELKDKENAVTHKERCQTGGYETEGEKTKKPSVFACALYIGIPIITVLIISALIVAIIGLSHADSTANKEAGLRKMSVNMAEQVAALQTELGALQREEAGLREMSVNMAEQVAALQTELGALQRELNTSIEYWKTLQMQQAVSTQRLIDNSIVYLEQHFQSALIRQNNDFQTAITQQNNDLQMTKTTVSNNVDELSQTRADVNQLNSKLHTHINTYESSVEDLRRLSSSLESHINTYDSNAEAFRNRDNMLQQDINGVSTGLMAISNDVNQLRTQVDMLRTNNSYHS